MTSSFVKELNETLVFLSMEGLPQTFFAWWSYRSAEESLIYKCYIIFLLFCIQYIYLARITWDAAIMKVVYTNLIKRVKKIFKDNLFFHFDILQSILDIHWFCGNGSSSKQETTALDTKWFHNTHCCMYWSVKSNKTSSL